MYSTEYGYAQKSNAEEFSKFDRIFYQKDDGGSQDFLLAFSTKEQEFQRLDLGSKLMQPLDTNTGKRYHQVELYDSKLFCVNGETPSIDVFLSAGKQKFYHKRIIHFANKGLRLEEKFSLALWKHHEAGILYRCLLGPLADGRYMNFDLPEAYFDLRGDTQQTVAKVIFMNLSIDDESTGPQDIVYAFDEVGKSIVCFDRISGKFFECNVFSGRPSRILQVISREKVLPSDLKRMYFYYPYNYFSQKEKNQLKATIRKTKQGMDLDGLLQNRYREILLCMEDGFLLKMHLLDEMPLTDTGDLWKISEIDKEKAFTPVDIAINGCTGEIYCLCREGITCLMDLAGKPHILRKRENRRGNRLLNMNMFS